MPVDPHPRWQNILVLMSDRRAICRDSTQTEIATLFPETTVTILDPETLSGLVAPQTAVEINWVGAVTWLSQQQFDAALIVTAPGQSPYTLGYLCHLAGIPIRVGHSHEFGGQVLSHCSPPPNRTDCAHLLSLMTQVMTAAIP